jgi:anti-sigma factor RsiW
VTCSQLVDIEDLVLGTIEPERARELRAHLACCVACRAEEELLREERALFTHRETCLEAPPVALGITLRARLVAEANDPGPVRTRAAITGRHVGPARRGATRLVRAGATALVSVARRGHVASALAAVLFAFVAFSRLGGAPLLPDPDGAGTPREAFEERMSRGAPALADEPLACTESGQTMPFSSAARAGAVTQLPSSASIGHAEPNACGSFGKSWSEACEQPIACSSLRQ